MIAIMPAAMSSEGFVYLTSAMPNTDNKNILGTTPINVQVIKTGNGILVMPAAIEKTLNGIIGRIRPMRTLYPPYLLAKASAFAIWCGFMRMNRPYFNITGIAAYRPR